MSFTFLMSIPTPGAAREAAFFAGVRAQEEARKRDRFAHMSADERAAAEAREAEEQSHDAAKSKMLGRQMKGYSSMKGGVKSARGKRGRGGRGRGRGRRQV